MVLFFACLSKSGLDEAEFSKLHANTKRGDIVGVTGFPGLCSLGSFLLLILLAYPIILFHWLHYSNFRED